MAKETKKETDNTNELKAEISSLNVTIDNLKTAINTANEAVNNLTNINLQLTDSNEKLKVELASKVESIKTLLDDESELKETIAKLKDGKSVPPKIGENKIKILNIKTNRTFEATQTAWDKFYKREKTKYKIVE